ncbi:MAG: hypothetical protein DRG27_02990 [Deltaproteobacteria bacterium]|nr:MAG: hypothetical protein DRG27_02990 [Deltaproteobacteria bacterium]
MVLKLLNKLLKKEEYRIDRGIVVFENTFEVIRAEKILKDEGLNIRVMGPPAEIQRGCDLVIEFPIVEELRVVKLLTENGLNPLDVVPVKDTLLEPVSILKKKDLGNYLMIRAANMKLTIDKRDLKIVNISGGGCPDVPYLADVMIGKSLKDVPKPRDIGYTLCAYALQLAYEEAVHLCLQ